MPELREVFEMTTKRMEPDVDAWREQQKHQRRSSRNKRFGAFAVAAAIGLAVVVVLIVANRPGTDTTTPAADPSPTQLPEVTRASLVDLGTGAVTPLPASIQGGSMYSTSPDGTMFAYSPCCFTSNPAFVANVGGTGERPITPEGVDGFGPRWSPDGSTLVYQQREGATYEIGELVVVDVTTGDTTRVTNLDPATYGWWFLSPNFGPDGETIVFHMPRGPDDEVNTRWDVWSVPVAGGEATLVARDASMGVYSPNGDALAYLDSPRGYWASSRLMVADADGSDPRVLVQGDQIELPRWSPDGTRIAYTDADGSHVVDVSTGEASLVAEGGTSDWFGDDTLVVVP